MNTKSVTAKTFMRGMGQAVADRTICRKITKKLSKPKIITASLPFIETISVQNEIEKYCQEMGYTISNHEVTHQDTTSITVKLTVTHQSVMENWSDIAWRVARGNSLLNSKDQDIEFNQLHLHLKKATILLSGRHLQHGDEDQPSRNMELFTNCATSVTSFLKFYLLLNGSGVGRSMDDEIIIVDYKNLPIVVPVIDRNHPDVIAGEIKEHLTLKDAVHFYREKIIHIFSVPDSREGWAKAIERMEIMAFQEKHRESVLLIDFSLVRPKGSPIKGMQNRPAAGPLPLMTSIGKIAQLRNAKMEPWRATMFADHYLAECVLVGGARRAARMATKSWRDRTIFDFISLKRDGLLWSSNNSVMVDEEFWNYVKNPEIDTELAQHARNVFSSLTFSAYHDKTGEPGLINQDKLAQNDSGFHGNLDGLFAESKRYRLDSETIELTQILAQKVMNLRYHQITNPCGEITLNMLGGFCVIGDVVPYHADNDEEALDAFKTATRALLRVNLMDNMYKKEVARTNRIGVGITGLHEWAWKRFNFSWKDIIDEKKSLPMWQLLASFKRAVVIEAETYSKKLGQNRPHSNTTIKPAGTTSKLFGLSEGAHLPSMREFLRWVQFRSDDPIIKEYKEKGYPTRELKSYSGTTIVGFPTQPEICKLGIKKRLVTAAEATPEEQYQYLMLLEKYWIRGVDVDGVTPLPESGNQVSYTLKYDPKKVSYEDFVKTFIKGQSSIRCCSVMPQIDTSAYEYQPEEMITHDLYQKLMKNIKEENELKEDIDLLHVECSTNICPF